MTNPLDPTNPVLGTADPQPNQNNDAQPEQSYFGRFVSGATGLASSAVNGIWNGGARAWNGTTWVAGGLQSAAVGTYNTVTSIPGGIAGAGRGIASIPGGISSARNLVGTISNGEARVQIQTMLEQALIRQSPPEIIELKALLNKLLTTPDTITAAQVRLMGAHLNLLSENEYALFNQLAPALGDEGRNTLNAACQQFTGAIASLDIPDAEEANLNLFKASILTDDVRARIVAMDTMLKGILLENRGALIKAMGYLQEALLPESDCAGETNNGIVANGLDLLSRKLIGPGGLMDGLNDRLTNEETGLLRNMADYLQRKLMERGGLVDQLDQWLTSEAHPLLRSARRKLNELHAAVVGENRPLIQRHSRELEPLLAQVGINQEFIFTRGELPRSDRDVLGQLYERLPAFYGPTPPTYPDMLLAIEAGQSIINRCYPNYEGLVGRIGTILQDTITDAINPLLTRVENLPQALMNNALGRTPVNPTSATPSSGTANTEGSGTTISEFLSFVGSSVLNSILETGRDAVSTQTLSCFAKLTTFALNLAKDEMKDPTLAEAKGEIETIIAAVGRAQQNGDWNAWEALYNHIKQAAITLNSLNKTIFNIPIPQFGTQNGNATNLERDYSNNISGLRRATNPQPVEAEVENWEDKVKEEKDELVDNATRLLTIQKTFEAQWFLGLGGKPPSENFYKNLLSTANTEARDRYPVLKRTPDGPDENKELRSAYAGERLNELFFEKVAELTKNPFLKAMAHFTYFLLSWGFHSFISSAATNYFDEVFKYIEQHKDTDHPEKSFDILRNQLTKNFTRYLTLSNNAYDNIAKDQHPFGTLDEMHNARMEKKEANRGFETDELYAKLGETVVEETLKSFHPFKFFSELPTPVKLLLMPLEYFIKGMYILFGAPIILTNLILTQRLETPIDAFLSYMQWQPKDIVRMLVDSSVGGLQNTSGYTHALNCVIREQLDVVLKELETGVADPGLGAAKKLSDIKKKQLTELVKNLFEILGKAKCNTVAEVRDLIEGKNTTANLNAAINGFFMDDVIEEVSNLLASTAQTLLDETQLRKLTYKFANLVNGTFQTGTEPTIQEMEAEERKIKDLSGQILRLTVNSAVEETFDFSGKKDQTETNGYIEKLKTLSKKLIDGYDESDGSRANGMRVDLAALATMDISTVEAQGKLNGIVDNVLDYERECSKQSFQAKGSKLSYDNKNAIRERYSQIAARSQPFVTAVTQMKTDANTLEALEAAVPKFAQIREILHGLPLRILRTHNIPTDEDLAEGARLIAILEAHLRELKRIGIIPQMIAQLQEDIDKIGEVLIAQKAAKKMHDFGIAQLIPNALIQQIANEKRALLIPGANPNPDLDGRIRALQEAIRLNVNDTILPLLNSKLNAIATATTNAEIDTATLQFLEIIRAQAIPQANNAFTASSQKYNEAFQRSVGAIDNSNLLDPNERQILKNNIRDSITAAQGTLEILATCERDTIKPVAYLDIARVPLKSLQEFASNIVFNRVNERMDGAIGLIKREETYRHGLINHLCLIPMLESRKKIQIDPLSGMKAV